ncbi:hydrogenase nickel incorporation protein HypB [Flavilitoribacter nigricans]|uniref:Hydrogenase accessory protein HypB n=1 Tax=Flavilitoribacter nigricans (strain ATCC 23147 / DSM 23189 / NBRC 102662 / NCIMB 1420 / SS-2) TaxID=1122177 RepID=A0A2D0N7T8_FLAN2|nr:hydrogenase nickel incorporation protein HypB [Flavilitoribacter nigricans]PHN03823.1 hydrogenase accessory protein HypB [Flavilitoribacter nigricans DSM 23189 = NBRC 102662]
MDQVQKSSKAARGTVTCDNSTMHLLKANDFVAESIRKQMASQNTLMINITSSAGSGKTTLLQETARRIGDKINMKILVGDLETERDADRLRDVGVDALQIVTGGICHLEAQMVWQAMENLDLDGVDLLIVENVGNLVCPASFDLGEDYRVTLIATTEGDDKPKKYPRMFLTSELMLVSKVDLLPYLPFSVDAVVADARDVNPNIDVLEISSTANVGIDEWCDWLLERVEEKKGVATAAKV